MDSGNRFVLMAPEAEAFIDNLELFEITQLGGDKWCRHHEYVEKLNIQAVMSAANNDDEFVKDLFVSCGKVDRLIYDLIVTDVWKRKVFSEMVKAGKEFDTSILVYMVLFHETTVANLLETILFHRETCEAADDGLLDLMEYCSRKLLDLLSRLENKSLDTYALVRRSLNKGLHAKDKPSKASGDDMTQSDFDQLQHGGSLKELEQQANTIFFDCAMKAISMLRYMADHASSLSMSVLTRLLDSLDVPLLLVRLMQFEPWKVRDPEDSSKEWHYAEGGRWEVAQGDNLLKLSKVESQILLALYQFFLNPDCARKYDLSSPHKKEIILGLRSHLNERTLDQLPVLGDLQRFLNELSFSEAPPPKRELVIEQCPQVYDNILDKYSGKWGKIAKTQFEAFLNPANNSAKGDLARQQAARWADTYNLDILESLITEPPKCAKCGKVAAKRCSRCQNEWYCGRPCQVEHWKKHKQACDLLHNSIKKFEDLNMDGLEA